MMKKSNQKKGNPVSRTWLVLFTLLLITAFIFPGCFRIGCFSDPDRYLFFDTLSLIEDYYIREIDNRDLLVEAFEGIAIELAIREMKKEKAEQAENQKEGAEDKKEPVTPEPTPTPTPTPAPKGEDENKDDKDNIENSSPYQKRHGRYRQELEERAPFIVQETKDKISIIFEKGSLDLSSPESKAATVEQFFKGFHYLQKKLNIPITDKELLWAGIDSMVRSLDPHSSFLSPKFYSQLKAETTGAFAGIGIEVGIRSDQLTVITPIMGTPAYKAGLKAMDRIVSIEGNSTEGISLMEAVDKIRGKIGTKVTLGISRKNIPEPFDVTIIRDRIEEYSVKYRMLPNKIGLIQIFKFNEKTYKELDDALTEFNSKAGGFEGLIIDMRNNPGGLLDQAVDVANRFLDTGIIVNVMGRGTLSDKRRFASARGTERHLPVLVLINLGSASGAEIVAGAIQDRNRGLLVGTRSFGKGSVQSIFKLPENSGLRLTTALYFTPSGRSIQATGIVPDINFTYPEEEMEILEEFSEKGLKNHLQTEKADPNAKAKITMDVEQIYQYYLDKKAIIDDPDYPEKSDWLMVYAEEIMASHPKDTQQMYDKAKALLDKMPKLPPKPEPEKLALNKGEDPEDPLVENEQVMLPPAQ